MIERLISACSKNRWLVCGMSLGLAVWGAWAMARVPLDAVPDISEVQIIVATEWPGRSPALIEDQVTFPIVTALLSTPRVKAVRGITDSGVSFVHVIFEDDVDLYWARSRVTEYLQSIRAQLPDGVSPTLGPDATGAGWVFEYALVDESGRHTLSELRSLQDWHLRFWLSAIPGVAEVASIGGFVKQYQVVIDPTRLQAYSLSMADVVRSIRQSNNDVEGRVIEVGGRELTVRGRGYLASIGDIEQVAVRTSDRGTPVRVRDVAQVRLGPEMRRGAAELDGRGEVVGGIVIMRFGEHALRVIERVKARLSEIENALPEGVTIVPTYDRSGLIRDSVSTITTTLIQEAVVVALVALVFLLHFRSALIPIITLPITVLASFIPMYYLGVSANIMSLGGIALALGELVDASLVMIENAHRRLSGRLDALAPSYADQPRAVIDAAQQVGRPIFFSLAIMLVSFAPVFLLEAQEGRMFRPLAFTKTFAIAAAALLSITLVPALMTVLVRNRRPRAEADNPLSKWLVDLYRPVLCWMLRRRWVALGASIAIVPFTIPLLFIMGSEFMPPLYEGSLLYMPTAPPGLSITEGTRLLQVQDRLLKAFPEVERVFGTVGRGTTATDNSPLGMVNTTVLLRPKDQWRPGLTLEKLQAEMDESLQFAGVPNTWTQPIRSRLDMLFTGIRTPIGVKVLGPDLAVIEQIGLRIEGLLARLPDTRNAYAERVGRGYFADIRIDRDAIARYGLSVEEVHDVIESAIGGENVTRTIEGRERYPVSVRYAQEFRGNLAALGRVLVRAPSGAHVPLEQLAHIASTAGPAMIRNENGQLAGYVFVDTTSKDVGGYVRRAQAAVEAEVSLPAGYRLVWTGDYEFQLRARRRLQVLIPLVIVSIFLLLCWTFRNVPDAVIVMVSVLYAMTGGVIAQWLLGHQFSVAVWVGYIALYGVAVQTGVVMVLYLHEALDHRLEAGGDMTASDIEIATLAGSVLRLRPKLMTVATTVLGLAPIMWSTGAGSDLMKPIAAPIVGGMVTSTIHVLFVTPLIFYIVKERALRAGHLRASGGAAE
jgi:Cu(I)/Ag(I) efflux system membrane protein CusA/SilA